MSPVMDGKPGANALGNAFAYLRFTNYDVQLVDNVRIAQIIWIINGCRVFLRSGSMMAAGCRDF